MDYVHLNFTEAPERTFFSLVRQDLIGKFRRGPRLGVNVKMIILSDQSSKRLFFDSWKFDVFYLKS